MLKLRKAILYYPIEKNNKNKYLLDNKHKILQEKFKSTKHNLNN